VPVFDGVLGELLVELMTRSGIGSAAAGAALAGGGRPGRPSRVDGPRLVPGAELIVGVHDESLVVSPAGIYTRLTPDAARIVARIDGTRGAADLAAGVRGPDPRARVEALLDELRRAGVVDGAAPTLNRRERLLSRLRRKAILRVPLRRRPPGPLTAPAGPLATARSRRVLVFAGIPALLTAAALVLVALVTLGLPSASASWLLAGVLLVQLACHEGAHAVVCRALGVRIREAGVGLWLWALPVAYVDRTDSYRLRSRRGHVAIALAGPASDLLWCGASAFVALSAGGTAASAAHALLVLQVVMLATNLNPLLPSDGFHALEAASRTTNLRHRAFGLLSSLVLRVPLPVAVRALPRRRRSLYLGYAAASAGYTLLLLGGLGFGVAHLVGGAT
jgi:putative peptide zinc metalloprotease protein